jgi:hypothetical protein
MKISRSLTNLEKTNKGRKPDVKEILSKAILKKGGKTQRKKRWETLVKTFDNNDGITSEENVKSEEKKNEDKEKEFLREKRGCHMKIEYNNM